MTDQHECEYRERYAAQMIAAQELIDKLIQAEQEVIHWQHKAARARTLAKANRAVIDDYDRHMRDLGYGPACGTQVVAEMRRLREAVAEKMSGLA